MAVTILIKENHHITFSMSFFPQAATSVNHKPDVFNHMLKTLIFLSVDIGSYGRDNDAAVFGRSDISNMMHIGAAKLPATQRVGVYPLPTK